MVVPSRARDSAKPNAFSRKELAVVLLEFSMSPFGAGHLTGLADLPSVSHETRVPVDSLEQTVTEGCSISMPA